MSKTKDTLISLPEDVLAQYIIEVAHEEVYWQSVTVDVESDTYSYRDIQSSDDIDHIEYDTVGDEAVVRIHATIEGTDYKKVASKTHRHPAEYESTTVDIGVTLEWHPERFGEHEEVFGYMEQMGVGYAPPDPEPQWRDV
jgi:hypothetical protein